MDDTDLGRPPRHERKKKVSQPKRLKAPPVPGATRRPCSTQGCGETVELPEKVPEWFAPILARQLSGEAPVFCAGCGAENARHEAEEERQAELLGRITSRRAAAGIPPKWAVQTFETLDRDKTRARALERAEQWSRGEIAGLVLHGPVGRGKTAIAAAAANMRLAVSAVRWLPVADLLMDLSSGFDSQERTRALRRLDATHGHAALVLDDLDKMKPTEHATGPLYLAINRWVEAELPLFVTLNRDLDDLSKWLPETFGYPIASRLSGYCRTIEVGGVDRRLS